MWFAVWVLGLGGLRVFWRGDVVCASDLGCDLLDGFWGVISFGCLCKLLCWFGFLVVWIWVSVLIYGGRDCLVGAMHARNLSYELLTGLLCGCLVILNPSVGLLLFCG